MELSHRNPKLNGEIDINSWGFNSSSPYRVDYRVKKIEIVAYCFVFPVSFVVPFNQITRKLYLIVYNVQHNGYYVSRTRPWSSSAACIPAYGPGICDSQ